MKYAKLKITTHALAKMIDLPQGGEIISAFQDHEDMSQRMVSFIISGAGEEVPEGCAIRVMSLIDVQATRLVIDEASGSFDTVPTIERRLV
jgi:hypothetical protein